MEVNYEGGSTVSLLLSNIDFQQFVDDGFFNPLKWMKYAELCRRVLTKKILDIVCDDISLLPNKSLYVVQQDAEFFPQLAKYLHDIRSCKGNVVVNSLKILHTFSSVKNTSGICNSKVYDQTAGTIMAIFSSVVVLVDFQTKLPTPFPLSVKKFLPKNNTAGSGIRVVTTLPVDVKVFAWSRVITMMDTDLNGHANNVAFVSLSFDCLASALVSKYPVALECPLHDNILHKQVLVVMKEIQLGQTVVVKMWQVSKEFRFVLFVSDLKAAFVSLQFFYE